MKHVLFSALLSLVPLAAAALPTGPFDDVVIFGDSLSDPGRAFLGSGGTIPPNPPYPNGQFTNGDFWATQLGADVASGRNFAVGGAKAQTDFDLSPDFTLQRLEFALSGVSLGSRPLTIIWLGSNDLGEATPANAATVVADTVTAITTGIVDLIGLGLSDFLVMGQPDLGLFPRAIALGTEAFATDGAEAFNAALQAALGPLNALANVDYFDMFAFFNDFIADPANAGLITNTDCLTDFLNCAVLGADSYLFFDDVHPTQGFHTALAGEVSSTLAAPVPLPAGVVLMVTGLGGLLLVRRRGVVAAPRAKA